MMQASSSRWTSNMRSTNSPLFDYAPGGSDFSTHGGFQKKHATPENFEKKTSKETAERRFIKTRSVENKKHFRAACRKASKLIHTCHSTFVRGKVSEMENNPQLLWKTVRGLLHPRSSNRWFEGLDTDALATGLCRHFTNKVKLIKDAIRTEIDSSTTMLSGFQSSETTNKLVKVQPATPAKYERLSSTAPTKTSHSIHSNADTEALQDRDGSGNIIHC